MNVKVFVKLILRRIVCIPSFCRVCGIDVRDYIAPEGVWEIIRNDIPNGNTLCYNCFCDLCQKHNINYGEAWKLLKNRA